MNTEEIVQRVRSELQRTRGVLRCQPNWVARPNSIPGRRLRLHPSDLYAYGKERNGGINERWLASTVKANNGEFTRPGEGLSYLVLGDGDQTERVLLREVLELLGDELLGSDVANRHPEWPVLGKLFDNYGALPFHLHQMDHHAELVGKIGKAEAYYFPPHLNRVENTSPYTYLGLRETTTKRDIKRCLERWGQGDNGILAYSTAHRLVPGTGWDIPTGILHGPGSFVTFEPQRAVDIGAVFQSSVDGRPVERHALVKDVPQDKHFDLDYLVELIDWEANLDPYFGESHQRLPKPVRDVDEMKDAGYRENWVTYDNEYFSAKELTVQPGQTAKIEDDGAYGCLVVHGFGRIESTEVYAPEVIRFGELTSDEFFVTASRAREGVTIQNLSDVQDLVLLKHFGPK